MGFRRKVHYYVEVLFDEKASQETLVPYISMDKTVPIRQARGKILKIGEVPRVGQGIQIDHMPVWPSGKDVADEVCSNETGTSGDQ
jgi:hypothetical protein